MFYDPHEKMINTTEETEYDFWYSSAAADELGCKNFVNGKPYTERIIRGKQPHLKAKYNDLVLVCSGAAKDQDITIKYKY